MKDKTNYITQEQFKALLDNIPKLSSKKKTLFSPKDTEMIFKIAYHCGLRINEVLKRKKEDFNLENDRVWLGKTKTKHRDERSIPPSFRDELSDWLDTKQKGLLFPGRDDKTKPISRQAAHDWIINLGIICKIRALTTPQSETHEKTKTHIFRKSIGKDMLNKGAKLNVVAAKLGHSNIVTTSKYLKVDLDSVQDWEAAHA